MISFSDAIWLAALLRGLNRFNIRSDRKSTRLNSSHLGISYAVFCLSLPPPNSTLFPYTTLFRSRRAGVPDAAVRVADGQDVVAMLDHQARHSITQVKFSFRHDFLFRCDLACRALARLESFQYSVRSEEHTSELQSLRHLVCRLLLVPATTEFYTLSLHDALPISTGWCTGCGRPRRGWSGCRRYARPPGET